jgi:GNAT superfamily N-acetyltransferase
VSKPHEIGVRLATEGDLEDVVVSLAKAFEDDPVWEYLLPKASSRTRRLARIFATMMRLQQLPQSTSYTDPDRCGAALWDPPGHWRMTTGEVLRGAPGFLTGFRADIFRSLRTMSTIERGHPKVPPHYYLAILGTRPDSQGKGIGSALIKPVLDRCDEQGLGSYLESSKESNIAFYARHGFSVTGEIRLPKGPLMWAMWRDPRAPDSEQA